MLPTRFRQLSTALLILFGGLLSPSISYALGQKQYVETTDRPDNFAIVRAGHASSIYVDASDYPGVQRAVKDLQADIDRVTGFTPAMLHENDALSSDVIVVGTLGKSALIDRLVSEGKIDVSAIRGKWESFTLQTVSDAFPDAKHAIVIVGSDKRGTTYGVYDVSEQIGVSPWYWWADVPVRHHDALTIRPGTYTQGPPAVKYRGIFLNDEAPSLTGWVKAKYGNYNHQFYEKVFELLLRLKANYLWPAMWNNAFSDDDPLNPKRADEYGIVMGTSHHEPMTRAQQEWKRYGTGPWDYTRNAEVLREFWRGGVKKNRDYENVVTLGMRGDGDLPMSDTANIQLLEQIVAEQRKIIANVYQRDAATVPQDWALYKEVMEYYDKGMRVPDDVTLLWCDDNWGNIRRLPTPEERQRAGGSGIYYHFDYVGDPRSYKWINTNSLPKVWEQMNMALQYGADRIWIVNVGDLKPMEIPTEFFLSLAWDPQRWPKERISEFGRLWAAREFGSRYASAIAEIVARYAKFNARRKPELLEPNTYSLVNYREAETVAQQFQDLTARAEALYSKLPDDTKDAFYELVLYPVKASAVVNQLYIAAGKNHLYAQQGRASANDLADEVERLFREDAELSSYYNHTLAGGKWNHMMDQTHIGYTFWNEPPVNNMPAVRRIELPAMPSMGVAVEGSESAWPDAANPPVIPDFDVFEQQKRFVDLFNRGRSSFTFQAKASVPWIKLSETQGTVAREQRIWVSIDWARVPQGSQSGSVEFVSDSGQRVSITVNTFRPATPSRTKLRGYVETEHYVSVEAPHYTKRIDAVVARWERIDDLGQTGSAMSTFPANAKSVTPGPGTPCLEYKVYLFHTGTVRVEAIVDPSLDVAPGRGLRYAISFDDEPPQVIDILANKTPEAWATAVKDSVRKPSSVHVIFQPGYHTLKFWMVDPGVVLQKLVVDLGGVRPSYLGPPETFFQIDASQ
jgi:Glycosyl hydrolase family 115/Gylcosyl hydrolase family 115 C-terminal domain/Glycosyl hydrolase family 67 N-terminus